MNEEVSQILEKILEPRDERHTSKQENIGAEIMARILNEVDELGGVYTETTGSQGSGKTSVNLSFANYYLRRYPRDKLFWSSTFNAPLQFLKLGDNAWRLMVEKTAYIEFRDRLNNGAKLDLPVTYFEDFDDLWRKALPGKCNAVFFQDRTKWMDFVFYMRSIYEWAHVFFDEFGEVCPSDRAGDLWKRIRKFSEDIKEVRKCNKNVHTNTQTTTDIDYRVRRKLMVRIFLPGARTDGKTRVYQKAVDKLVKDPVNGNMAYLEWDGRFGITRFRDIFRPLPSRSWEARVIGGKPDDD